MPLRPLQTEHSCLKSAAQHWRQSPNPAGSRELPQEKNQESRAPSTMCSQELWLENERKCTVVRKSKPSRKRQELLAIAFGVKVGLKGGFLWSPLKLFACSQISSLVRRAALTHNDNHFNYEKTHNFKVRVCLLPAAVRRGWEWERILDHFHVVIKAGGSRFLGFPHNPAALCQSGGWSSWLYAAALHTCTGIDLVPGPRPTSSLVFHAQ